MPACLVYILLIQHNYIPGDAYRYTIQPVFRNLKHQFQCHIQLKKPVVLYEMFFHIKVPGPYGPESEIETPRVFKVNVDYSKV